MSVNNFHKTIIKILWPTFLLRPCERICRCSLNFETETETFGLWSWTVRLILRLLICGLKYWDRDSGFNRLVSSFETETDTTQVSVSVSKTRVSLTSEIKASQIFCQNFCKSWLWQIELKPWTKPLTKLLCCGFRNTLGCSTHVSVFLNIAIFTTSRK